MGPQYTQDTFKVAQVGNKDSPPPLTMAQTW